MSFDIIAEIAQRLDVDEAEVRPVLDSVVERIRQQVSHYGYARVAGLGTFRGHDGEMHFEPDAVLAETVNRRFAGLEPVRLAEPSRSTTAPESTALSAAASSSSREDLPEEHTLAEFKEEDAPGAADRPADRPSGEPDAADLSPSGPEEELDEGSTTPESEGDFADVDETAYQGTEEEGGEITPHPYAPGPEGDRVDEMEDPGSRTPSAEPAEELFADEPAEKSFARAPEEESFSVQSTDEAAAAETGSADEVAAAGIGSADEAAEAEIGSADEAAGAEIGSADAPDRPARPHESMRRDWPSERTDRRGLDGTTSRRNTILIGAGLIIVIAAAVVAYFAMQPAGPTETVTPDEPAVAENGGETESTVPADTEAVAVGDAFDQPPGTSLPAETETNESSPLRSSDGIDPAAGGFTIVVYSERSEGSARDVADDYETDGFRTGVIRSEEGSAARYRVGVGQFETLEAAMDARNELAGTELPADAWVYRLE